MTTPTITQIYNHYSVRHYKPDPVPRSLIESIISAAQRSSTSSNLQMYSAIAVTDATKRARLAKLCGNQAHIIQAPAFIAWCADLSRLDRVCQWQGYKQVTERVENFLLAVIDATIAMQTAALAAESLGLGICFIGAIRNQPEEVIEFLALPKLVFPIVGMTVGWPASKPSIKHRLPIDAILHFESYDSSNEVQALLDYDRIMMESNIYQERQVRVDGGDGELQDYGWMEHSARRVSTPQRTGLGLALLKQGFELK